MSNPKFFIGKREISSNFPPYIIAEMSANHNGSIQTAIETIKAAKRAGADCIKLQTYTADTITIDYTTTNTKNNNTNTPLNNTTITTPTTNTTTTNTTTTTTPTPTPIRLLV